MAIDNTQIHPGMQVVGANGQNIGSIKEVRGGEFLVNRRMHRDVWVPFSAVVSVVENDVTLNVVADQIDKMGWQEPPLPGEHPS